MKDRSYLFVTIMFGFVCIVGSFTLFRLATTLFLDIASAAVIIKAFMFLGGCILGLLGLGFVALVYFIVQFLKIFFCEKK